jgi:nitrous oxide reductase accessory protein NosL
VTEYSSVDWKVFEQDGHEYLPAPTAAETFADATKLTYVAESEIKGGMGPDLIPFSDSDNTELCL